MRTIGKYVQAHLINNVQPWLSGPSAGLGTKGSLVQLLV